MWVKNTDGKRDAVLTFTLLGFVIVVIKLLLAGSTLVISGNTYTFGDIDAAVIGAILTPTLGAYVARRYTDRKYLTYLAELNQLNEARDVEVNLES